MNRESVPLIGIPTETQWPSMVIRDTSDGGKFFCSVAIGPTPDASTRGRVLVEQIQELTQAPVTDAVLTTFFQQQFSFPVVFAGGYLLNDQLLCFASPEASVILYRKGAIEKIAAPQPHTAVAFMKGKLEADDRVVFGTNVFFSSCSTIFETGKSLRESADGCAVVIQTSPKTAQIAAILLDNGVPTVTVESLQQTTTPPIQTTHEQSVSSEIQIQQKPRTHRSYLFVVQKYKKVLSIVCALLIFILVFLAVSQITGMNRTRRIKSSVDPYHVRLEQARTDVQTNKLSSLQQLRGLQKELRERIEQTKKDKTLQRAYEDELTQVNSLYDQFSGEKRVEKLQVFYDFRLVSQDFVASQVAFDIPGKQAVFLDGSHSKLLSLSLEKKQSQVLSVDEKLKNPFAVTVVNRKAYVLGQEGVVELSLPLDQIGRMAIEATEQWQGPRLIGSYGTNAYIVDAKQRNIYRYDLEDQGASPSAWLASKEGIDFEKIMSIAVDGDVWMTTSEGSIHKFTRGDEVPFTVTGLLDPFTSTVLLYTQKESDYLFVLEPRQKRFVLLKKSGEFVASIISEDLAATTSLIVDEKSKNAYILSGSLVYEVNLPM